MKRIGYVLLVFVFLFQQIPGFGMSGMSVKPVNPQLVGIDFSSGYAQLVYWGGYPGKDRLKEDLNLFLTGIAFPMDELVVDLNIYNLPSYVLSPMLEGTELGRIFLKSDLKLKILVGEMLEMEGVMEIGKEKREAPDFRIWIEPEQVEILEGQNGMKAGVKRMRLRVKAEFRNEGEVKEVMEKRILPQVEKIVNEGRGFALLREAMVAVYLAQWYKERGSVVSDLDRLRDTRYMKILQSPKTWTIRDYMDWYTTMYWRGNGVVGGINPETKKLSYRKEPKGLNEEGFFRPDFLFRLISWPVVKIVKVAKVTVDKIRAVLRRKEAKRQAEEWMKTMSSKVDGLTLEERIKVAQKSIEELLFLLMEKDEKLSSEIIREIEWKKIEVRVLGRELSFSKRIEFWHSLFGPVFGMVLLKVRKMEQIERVKRIINEMLRTWNEGFPKELPSDRGNLVGEFFPYLEQEEENYTKQILSCIPDKQNGVDKQEDREIVQREIQKKIAEYLSEKRLVEACYILPRIEWSRILKRMWAYIQSGEVGYGTSSDKEFLDFLVSIFENTFGNIIIPVLNKENNSLKLDEYRLVLLSAILDEIKASLPEDWIAEWINRERKIGNKWNEDMVREYFKNKIVRGIIERKYEGSEDVKQYHKRILSDLEAVWKIVRENDNPEEVLKGKKGNLFREIGFDGEKFRLGWVVPPSTEEINKFIEDLRSVFTNKKHVIFVGMGGSINTIKLLKDLYNMEDVLWFDVPDKALIKRRISESEIDLTETAFVFVSKSGKTYETNTIAKILKELVREKMSDKEKADKVIENNFVWLVDKGNEKELVMEDVDGRIKKLPLQPNGRTDIGGRFSLPWTGVFFAPIVWRYRDNVEEIKADLLADLWKKVIFNPLNEDINKRAFLDAYTLFIRTLMEGYGPRVVLVLPERLSSSAFESVRTWVTQIWMESIGGKEKRITPKIEVLPSDASQEELSKYMIHGFVPIVLPWKKREESYGDHVNVSLYLCLYMYLLTTYFSTMTQIKFLTQGNVQLYKDKLKEIEKVKSTKDLSVDDIVKKINAIVNSAKKKNENKEFVDLILYGPFSKREIKKISSVIESKLGKRVVVFVYPGPDYNHHSFEALVTDCFTVPVILVHPKASDDVKKIAYATFEVFGKENAVYGEIDAGSVEREKDWALEERKTGKVIPPKKEHFNVDVTEKEKRINVSIIPRDRYSQNLIIEYLTLMNRKEDITLSDLWDMLMSEALMEDLPSERLENFRNVITRELEEKFLTKGRYDLPSILDLVNRIIVETNTAPSTAPQREAMDLYVWVNELACKTEKNVSVSVFYVGERGELFGTVTITPQERSFVRIGEPASSDKRSLSEEERSEIVKRICLEDFGMKGKASNVSSEERTKSPGGIWVRPNVVELLVE